MVKVFQDGEKKAQKVENVLAPVQCVKGFGERVSLRTSFLQASWIRVVLCKRIRTCKGKKKRKKEEPAGRSLFSTL